MTAYLIFSIHIISLFPSFIFSQMTAEDMLIRREVETLREQAKNNRILSESMDSEFTEYTEYTDTLIASKYYENISEGSDDESLGFYGYNILQTFPERIIWNNQPPSGEYVLGTGDEVIIEIWGDTQLREIHTIDQYGKINIDKIGQINLSGLAFNDLQPKLISKFQSVYSSLKGPNETAYLDISIGKLKSINVTFVGESKSPGIHAIHSFSTIITGIMQTGGISTLGSLRDIQIIRNGKKVESLDIYDYLSNGNAESDMRLLDGDIVFIPIRYSTIVVKGEVMRPALYELLPRETLGDIIHFAGGLTATSQKIIRLNRLEDFVESSTTHLIDFNAQESFIIKDGDTIEVYSIPSSDHKVYIFGQVKKSGSFAFDTNKETRLMDILQLAGGINDETYLQTIYTEVGEIIRNHPETNYPEIIEFNIDKLMAGDINENKILQNWDIILIRQNPNFISPKKVSILGEVNVPGIYTLQKKWENLNDIIERAGGFTDQAFHGGIQLYRNNGQVAFNNFDIILLEGDSLMVPEHPGIIQVLGEVNRPGFIQYDKRKNLVKYIENAGGFTEYSDKNNITIIYANGNVNIKKRFRSLKITEGATVIVNKKEELEPFNLTEFATNIASIITSIATLFLLVNN